MMDTVEKLTRGLVEDHLMSYIEIKSEVQGDGVTRWAWCLSALAGEPPNGEIEKREFSFEFKSHDAARNFAFGWVRRNRPMLERAAVLEARSGIRYRA